MNTFLVVNVENPEHIRIRGIRSWVSLVATIHQGEFYGILDEENRLILTMSLGNPLKTIRDK